MFTVYNEQENRFQLVEEPDPSLSYTYTDYLQWKFEEREELIRRKIFKMGAALRPGHQEISIKLSSRVFNFPDRKNCKVFAAPFDVRMPVKNKKQDNEVTTVVQPDISVICDETKIDGRGCPGAPEPVMEILSAGNTEKEVKLRFGLYEEAGVKKYRIVYPAEENIAVFILNEAGQYEGAKIFAGKEPINAVQ